MAGSRTTITPSGFALVGFAAVAGSAVLPWARGIGPAEEIVLHPVLTDAFRPSALLVLLLGGLGVSLYLVQRSLTALVGLAGLLWAGWAMLIWVLGVRLQWLLPESVLLDGAVVRLSPGVVIALVGGMTAFAGAVADTASAGSADPRRLSLPVWHSLGALTVVVLLLWARSFRWFLVDAQPIEWSVGAEALPGIGDVFSLVILATAAAAAATVLVTARWVPVAVIVGGATTTMLAVVAFVAVGGLSSAVEATLDRFGPTAGWDLDVSTGSGLVLTCVGGLAAMAFGIVSMRAARPSESEAVAPAPWSDPPGATPSADPFNGPSPF